MSRNNLLRERAKSVLGPNQELKANALIKTQSPYEVQQQQSTTSFGKRSLHDMEAFKKKKFEQSATFFKDTRVQTCSHIVMKGGKAVAVAFPLEKTGWKNPNSYCKQRLSSETQSMASVQFKKMDTYHAGMLKKPLTPYDPNAFRSRLPQPTVVMPYKNSSQIVIGDRTTDDGSQFKTVNKLLQIKPNMANAVTNGGIIAAQNKWIHYNQWK